MGRHNFFPQAVLVAPRMPRHLQHADISKVPQSTWYKYTLLCGHEVYSKVRIKVPQDYSFKEHYIRCPVGKHQPLNWQAVDKMEAVSDESVSNVLSGTAFILPSRILRTDGHSTRLDADGNSVHQSVYSGNPFPYASSERDY